MQCIRMWLVKIHTALAVFDFTEKGMRTTTNILRNLYGAHTLALFNYALESLTTKIFMYISFCMCITSVKMQHTLPIQTNTRGKINSIMPRGKYKVLKVVKEQ